MNTEDGSSSVKWKSYDATILENLHTHYIKASFCDATILCEGKMFPVHKLILSLSSEYFNDIFSSTPPWNQPYIVITGITAANMDYILTYIYSGEISVSQLELPSFLIAAECLKIKRLDSSSESVHENPHHSTSVQNRNFRVDNFQQSKLANRKNAIVPKPGGNKRHLSSSHDSSKRQKLSTEHEENMYFKEEEEEEEHQMTDYDINETGMQMTDDNVTIKSELMDSEYDMHNQIPEWEEDHTEIKHSMDIHSEEHMDPEDNESYFLPVKQVYLDDSYEEYMKTNVPQSTTSIVKPSTSYPDSITPSAPNMKIHSTSITLHPSSRTNTQDTITTQKRSVLSISHSSQKAKAGFGSERFRQDPNPSQKPGSAQFKSKYGSKPFNSSVSINPLVILESNLDEGEQEEDNLDDSISSITEIDNSYQDHDHDEQTKEMLLQDPDEIDNSSNSLYSDSSITISNARNEMGEASTDEYRLYDTSRQRKGTSVSHDPSFSQRVELKHHPKNYEQKMSEVSKKQTMGSNLMISDGRKSGLHGMPHQQQMGNVKHHMLSSSSLQQKQTTQRQHPASGQKHPSGSMGNQYISSKQHSKITKFQQQSIPRQQINVIPRPESLSSPELRRVSSPVTQQHQRQMTGQRVHKFGAMKKNSEQTSFSKPDSSYERKESSSPINPEPCIQNSSIERTNQSSMNISSSLSSQIPQCLTESTSITISQTSNRVSCPPTQRPGPKSKVSRTKDHSKIGSPVPKEHSISSPNLPPPGVPISQAPVNLRGITPVISRSQTPMTSRPQTPIASRPQTPIASRPQTPIASRPQTPTASRPQTPTASRPQTPIASRPHTPIASRPQTPIASRPQTSGAPRFQTSGAPRAQTSGTPRAQTSAAMRAQTSGAPRVQTPGAPRVSTSKPQPTVSQAHPAPTMLRPEPSSTPRLQPICTSRPQQIQTPAPRSSNTNVTKTQPPSVKSPNQSPQHVGSPKNIQQTPDPRSPKTSGPKQIPVGTSKPQLSSPKHSVTDSTLPLIEVKQEPTEGAEPYDEQQHIEDLERLFNSGAFGSLPEAPDKKTE